MYTRTTTYAQSPVVSAAGTRIWTPERSHPRADDGALRNGALGARP